MNGPELLSLFFACFRLHLRKSLGGDQHGLADERYANIAREMQQHFGELVLGPALLEGEAQMNVELGMTPAHRVRDHADQRAGLKIEAGTGPQRAEHGLGRNVYE